ncbi:DUF998 domain-containing protein [Thermococcus sp.]|uniref:DUF998 domain-containing protein n=1 Tax=Thermococcus sp. TaxID=35749 RepID=UPI00262E58A6|nr:DUF998 domain-containing protein [Thermococcus sp.]
MNSSRFPAYLSLLLPLVFFAGLLVVIWKNPWFSFTDNALSDMGSLHNPHRWYFNGFLMIFATIGFIASVGMLRRGLSYLMPLAMICLFLVGVFPEEHPLHLPLAVLTYLLALADVVIVGVKLGRAGTGAGYLWSGLAVLTLAVMIILIEKGVFRGLAIPELIGVLTVLAWFVYLGLLQLRGK